MLEVAEENLSNERYSSACNRAYYALFYAASALLYSKGKTYGKHSTVLAAFRQLFIKTGEFDKKWSDDYGFVMDSRHSADYDLYDSLKKRRRCSGCRKSTGLCRGSEEMVTKKRPALKLSPRERKAVQEFLAKVRQAYGKRIQHAALFGSKARGDATEHSDVDILLIITDDRWNYRQPFSVIVSDIALKYDVLLDIRVIPAARWQYLAEIQAGLYQNISRDAVALKFDKGITPTSKAG